MAKIAILMMVHKNGEQADRLIRHLARDFDVYVHLDRRSRISLTRLENVRFYRNYESYWGSWNLVMASLLLFREAWKTGYDRYILISGQDLPLKSSAAISAFFENNNAEYIDTGKLPRVGKMPRVDLERLRYWHPDIKRRPEGPPPGWGRPRFDGGFFQQDRPPPGPGAFWRDTDRPPRPLEYQFYGGAQWNNLTHNCVSEIFNYLEKDTKYIDRFRGTFAGDEVFYQTLVQMIPGLAIVNNCLRYIDWKSGPEMPRTLRMEDYDAMKNSENLFARKFDPAVDGAVMEKLYSAIGEDRDGAIRPRC